MVSEVRITKLADGWNEADWWHTDYTGEKKEIIYRYPASACSSAMQAITCHFIDDYKVITTITTKIAYNALFRYGISRSTINRVFKRLEALGYIEKGACMTGRNSYWFIKKKIGSTGETQ